MIADVALPICFIAGGIGWAFQIWTWFAHLGVEQKAQMECWLAVLFGIAALAGLIWALAIHNRALTIWMAVNVALSVGSWIHNNRKRRKKRAHRALGAKSRARVAALVRKARETAKPRPSLRPAPGGAS